MTASGRIRREGLGLGFLFEAARHYRCQQHLLAWGSAAILIAGGAIWQGGVHPLVALGLFVYGWLWWTFIEYHLHRRAMHWIPETPWLLKWREKLLPHITHHDRPDDPTVPIVRTPTLPMIYAVVCILIGWLIVPFWISALIVVGGGWGYVGYEFVHYATHRCRMTGRIGRRLKQHHLFHHYRDETVNFGVSTTIWDRILGTHYTPGVRRAAA
ncbi:MAG: sterol desaturase family protein [Pseudomonadota bacterium]